MLKVNNLSISFGSKTLFEKVNLEFKGDNCYGIIGANGAGKSTFLKILSNELESTKGDVSIDKNERLSILSQNHNEFDDCTVLDTIIMGDEMLYSIKQEKDAIYMKEDFSDADGIRAGELEALFEDKNGWQSESDAAILLSGLGLSNNYLTMKMKELKDKEKVKVLLARAIFGTPDILLLDEPTNGLDLKSKMWLEEFLINFKNTVLLVSHDRHFLNKVCTHTLDIDYGKITLYIGNYEFWLKSSELIQKQMKDSNKRKEDKMKELQDFIARFSANASKSKQATSRKKSLEKIVLDDIRPSTRKYPYVNFEMTKRLSKEAVSLDKICYSIDGKDILKNVNLYLSPNDKVALIGGNEIAKTTLLKIIDGELKPTSGNIRYGSNSVVTYFAKNHEKYFESDINLVEMLQQYTTNKEESFARGFLGRMLFSGEDGLKSCRVLSGGEKVRIMLSKMMLEKGNILLLDEPTNHLDMESINSLNEALQKFESTCVIATHDQEIIETVCNRLVEIKQDGKINDKQIPYAEYIEKYGIEE